MKIQGSLVAISFACVIAGLSVGGTVGVFLGANLAREKQESGFVSLANYQSACDRGEKMSELYYAERAANVLLMKKHEVAMRLLTGRADQKSVSPSRFP